MESFIASNGSNGKELHLFSILIVALFDFPGSERCVDNCGDIESLHGNSDKSMSSRTVRSMLSILYTGKLEQCNGMEMCELSELLHVLEVDCEHSLEVSNLDEELQS